jgi:hypothetical protein
LICPSSLIDTLDRKLAVSPPGRPTTRPSMTYCAPSSATATVWIWWRAVLVPRQERLVYGRATDSYAARAVWAARRVAVHGVGREAACRSRHLTRFQIGEVTAHRILGERRIWNPTGSWAVRAWHGRVTVDQQSGYLSARHARRCRHLRRCRKGRDRPLEVVRVPPRAVQGSPRYPPPQGLAGEQRDSIGAPARHRPRSVFPARHRAAQQRRPWRSRARVPYTETQDL